MMGSLVCTYNYIGFRLAAPPFSLSQTTIGFVFALYLVGAASSALMGELAGRLGRRRVIWIAAMIELAGVAVTAAGQSRRRHRRRRADHLGFLRRPFDRLELGRIARADRPRPGDGALSVLLLPRLERGGLGGRLVLRALGVAGRRRAARRPGRVRAARRACGFPKSRRRAIFRSPEGAARWNGATKAS